MPSQSPVHSSSWYIPSETESGPSPEPPALNSTVYDNGRSGCGDHCLGWEISTPETGYDAHLLGHPPGLPVSLPRSLNGRGGTVDGHSPRFKAYGTIYTDDVRMKLGDAIRRQCFNCRATHTTTWRRSTLSRGKLVRFTVSLRTNELVSEEGRSQLCNKCGLFERTHSAPRPKEFPRKRRSQPAFARQSTNPQLFNGQGYHNYNDCPKDFSFIPHIPNAFAMVDGETPPQDTSWMTQIVPHISTTPSLYPTTAEHPRIFGTDIPSLYTQPIAGTCTPSPRWELLPPDVN